MKEIKIIIITLLTICLPVLTAWQILYMLGSPEPGFYGTFLINGLKIERELRPILLKDNWNIDISVSTGEKLKENVYKYFVTLTWLGKKHENYWYTSKWEYDTCGYAIYNSSTNQVHINCIDNEKLINLIK